MEQLRQSFEIIFVNDGSSDQSPAVLEELQKSNPQRIKILTIHPRQGQTSALRKGLALAQGKVVITLDADLQNDPADILELLKKMENDGYDCVCGWRKNREDTPLKAGLSKLGNILERLFTGMAIHDVSCTLRAYKKECVYKIPLHWEGQHRFIPLSLSLRGYKVGEIISNHRERPYGVSKYSHRRILRVVIDFFRVLITRGR